MHNVSQWPNLRQLGEQLGGAEGLLEVVSLKKATESVRWRGITNGRRERVPNCGGSDAETTGGKVQASKLPTKH